MILVGFGSVEGVFLAGFGASFAFIRFAVRSLLGWCLLQATKPSEQDYFACEKPFLISMIVGGRVKQTLVC